MSTPAQRWRDDNPTTFRDTILTAAEAIGVQPLAVEKDYWVCEALRAITAAYPDNIIFKGGTSLEKLRIIQRFSEDLDLLVIGNLGEKNQPKNTLKGMLAAAANAVHATGKITDAISGGAPGSFHRRGYLSPTLNNAAAAGIADANAILVELGQSGGPHPSRAHQVESLLSRQLGAINGFDTTRWSDLAPINVTILHPGRTLIEKLLRVNNFAVRQGKQDDVHGWPRIGRQFYDIWALLGNESVLELLHDEATVTDILDSVAEVSAAFTPDEPVPEGGFATSPVFHADSPFAGRLKDEHATAINNLYYGDPSDAPTFDDVLERVHDNAALLTFARANLNDAD